MDFFGDFGYISAYINATRRASDHYYYLQGDPRAERGVTLIWGHKIQYSDEILVQVPDLWMDQEHGNCGYEFASLAMNLCLE